MRFCVHGPRFACPCTCLYLRARARARARVRACAHACMGARVCVCMSLCAGVLRIDDLCLGVRNVLYIDEDTLPDAAVF